MLKTIGVADMFAGNCDVYGEKFPAEAWQGDAGFLSDEYRHVTEFTMLLRMILAMRERRLYSKTGETLEQTSIRSSARPVSDGNTIKLKNKEENHLL